LGHIFVADNMGLPSTTMTLLALKSNAFSVIIQSNRRYAVRGHDSRSPIRYQFKACTRLSISD